MIFLIIIVALYIYIRDPIVEKKQKTRQQKLLKQFLLPPLFTAEHLREAISHTESKVKRRTAELRKTNQYMIGRELKMIELKKRLSDLENLLDKNYEDQV